MSAWLLMALAWGQASDDEEETPGETVVVEAPSRPWLDVKRGARKADPSTLTGVYALTRRDVEGTPGALEDVARAAHLLPGVVSDGDYFSGFHVRGGEISEVVFVLDRVPLDNPFHLAGFSSLFNPDLVRAIRFQASAAPANVPALTSAVVEVDTWDGEVEDSDGFDGSVDISAVTARAHAIGRLDREGRFTFALAARRSYLEAYATALQGAGLLDRGWVAPEFGEVSGRFAWRPNARNRWMITAMHAWDGLRFVDTEDDASIEIDGALEIDTHLTLLSADHRWKTDRGSLQTTLAFTRDRTAQVRELERDTLAEDIVLERLYARSDGVWSVGSAQAAVGADVSRMRLRSAGSLQDQRAFPRWVQPGLGAYGFQVVEVDPDRRPWTEASAYAQTEIGAPFGPSVAVTPDTTYTPGIRARAGIRVTYAGRTDAVLASPRAGLSVPLPTGTIPKVSVGLYQKAPRDPFQLDPAFGNAALGPERARHLVLGIDQALPIPGGGGLFRVEVYDIALTELVVNPDTAESVAEGQHFDNLGSGYSRGLDMMLAGRSGRFEGQLAYALLYTERTNPLHRRWSESFAPLQDQRHTLSGLAQLQIGRPWKAMARYQFHTGRPAAAVDVLSEEWASIQLACLDCTRLGPTHQLDLRMEWVRNLRRFRFSAYLEVLNVGNIRSPYLPSHRVEGTEVVTTSLDHLPMRPFIGLRADF